MLNKGLYSGAAESLSTSGLKKRLKILPVFYTQPLGVFQTQKVSKRKPLACCFSFLSPLWGVGRGCNPKKQIAYEVFLTKKQGKNDVSNSANVSAGSLTKLTLSRFVGREEGELNSQPSLNLVERNDYSNPKTRRGILFCRETTQKPMHEVPFFGEEKQEGFLSLPSADGGEGGGFQIKNTPLFWLKTDAMPMHGYKPLLTGGFLLISPPLKGPEETSINFKTK